MNLNNFLDGLSKEKYLVYFVLAWAGMLVFWAIDTFVGTIINITSGYTTATAYTGVHLFSELFNLGAGLMLGILALKMLIPNFMPTLKREQTLIYFLLLWAGGFFFYGIADFVWYGMNGISARDFFDVLHGLSSFAGGAVLALFAWKLLQSKTSSSLEEKLQTAV